MTFGIGTTGFVLKTQADIEADLQARQRADIDEQIDYSPEEPLGQINGIFSAAASELWEVLQAVYKSFDVLAAQDEALTTLGELTGTRRGQATKSVKFLTLNATIGTVIPAGALVSSSADPTVQFVLPAAITIAAAVTPGVKFEATVTGPLACNAGLCTVISTPVLGWTSVVDPEDAVVGSDIQSIAAYRQAILAAPSAIGGSTALALKQDVLQLNDRLPGTPIKSVRVSENTGAFPDADGRPPGVYEVLIDDSALVQNNTIAQRIWDSASLGTQSFGTAVGIATDENGETHVVYFSRPTAVQIRVDLVLAVSPGHAQRGQVVEALINRMTRICDIGRDVDSSQYAAAVLDLPGIVAVRKAWHKKAPLVPTNEFPIPIGSRQRATYSDANITVTFEPYQDL